MDDNGGGSINGYQNRCRKVEKKKKNSRKKDENRREKRQTG